MNTKDQRSEPQTNVSEKTDRELAQEEAAAFWASRGRKPKPAAAESSDDGPVPASESSTVPKSVLAVVDPTPYVLDQPAPRKRPLSYWEQQEKKRKEEEEKRILDQARLQAWQRLHAMTPQQALDHATALANIAREQAGSYGQIEFDRTIARQEAASFRPPQGRKHDNPWRDEMSPEAQTRVAASRERDGLERNEKTDRELAQEEAAAFLKAARRLVDPDIGQDNAQRPPMQANRMANVSDPSGREHHMPRPRSFGMER